MRSRHKFFLGQYNCESGVSMDQCMRQTPVITGFRIYYKTAKMINAVP